MFSFFRLFIFSFQQFTIIFRFLGLAETAINMPYCELCSWAPVQLCEDFPKIGLWPLTPEGKVFVEFSYLLHNSILQHHSPTLSMKSMLSSLKFISALDGKVNIPNFCCFYSNFFIYYLSTFKI